MDVSTGHIQRGPCETTCQDEIDAVGWERKRLKERGHLAFSRDSLRLKRYNETAVRP